MVANTGTYLDTPFHRFADGHDLTGLALERVADVPGVVITAPEPRPGPSCSTGSTSPGGPSWCAPAGTPTGAPTATARPATRSWPWPPPSGWWPAGPPWWDRLGQHRRHPHRRAPDPHRPAGRRHPIVEHLRGLDALGDAPFRFFAVPPAIEGLGTFIVRAFALT
jgi:arylformamidase